MELTTAQAAAVGAELVRLSAFGAVTPATVTRVVDKARAGALMLSALPARRSTPHTDPTQILGRFPGSYEAPTDAGTLEYHHGARR